MRSAWFLVRVELAVSVRDDCTAERVMPSAEAISRWETDGGAPAPRDELNDQRCVDREPPSSITPPSLEAI